MPALCEPHVVLELGHASRLEPGEFTAHCGHLGRWERVRVNLRGGPRRGVVVGRLLGIHGRLANAGRAVVVVVVLT